MGLIIAATLAVVSFVIYTLVRQRVHLLADAFIFFLFVFAIVLYKDVGVFYVLLFAVVILLDQAASKFRVQPKEGKAFSAVLLQLVIGVALYVAITFISASRGGNIVGAPELAASSTSGIAQNMRPTFVGMLGIIENRAAIVMMELLFWYGVAVPFLGIAIRALGYVLPIIIAATVMAIYHVAAYSVAITLLIWAAMAFAAFIGSYVWTKDSLAADLAHFINNFGIDIRRTLAIVV